MKILKIEVIVNNNNLFQTSSGDQWFLQMDGSYEGRASDEDHCGAENRKLYSGMFFINHNNHTTYLDFSHFVAKFLF